MQMNLRLLYATAACFLTPIYTDARMPGNPDAGFAELETIYHIQIHCQADLSTSFPEQWMDPTLQLEAAPIHMQDAQALLPALVQFLEAHPLPVIRQNLEHIYLLGKLRFRGRDYGGTHTGKSMYLVWDQSRKNTPEFMLERFHSEFSSILREYHAFPDQRWETINPAGFGYSGNGFEMLGTGPIYVSTEQDQANGFLMRYSMSSLENDFNTISAWLFTRPDDLDAVSMRYEKIRQKRALAEEFYHTLSDQYVFHPGSRQASL